MSLIPSTPSRPTHLQSSPSDASKLSSTSKHSSTSSSTTANPCVSISAPALYSGSGFTNDPFLVDWAEKNDKANPYNWSKGYRWFQTALLAFTCLCPVWVSSSYVGGVEDIMVRWRVSEELCIGGLSLYLVGMAIGPLVWAPLSELLGRRTPFFLSFPLFAVFNLACVYSTNIQSLLVVRFFAGVFGSAPLTNGGGQVSDMWSPEERVIPGGLFTLAPLLGPVLGPLISGFIGQYHGYKAVFWVQFGFACVMLLLNILLVPETYGPTLLRSRATQLRKTSEAEGYCYAFVSKHDAEVDRKGKGARDVILQGLGKPFALLFREVIVWTLSIYVSLIYGILYLMFTAFPIVFQLHRGWSLSHSGLALLGIGIGMIIGTALNRLSLVYHNRVRSSLPPGSPVPPEARLPMACLGAILVPASLFWFAWTSLPPTHWAVPIVASVPFGIGYILIFTSIMIYLIDAYTLHSASALAANTVMRSLFGAAFPMFSTYMFDNLGPPWAITLLAFLSLACTPMPFLFFKYGHVLRRHSRYAPSTDPLPLDTEKAIGPSGLDTIALPTLPTQAHAPSSSPGPNTPGQVYSPSIEGDHAVLTPREGVVYIGPSEKGNDEVSEFPWIKNEQV